jgi:hypothetical protein
MPPEYIEEMVETMAKKYGRDYTVKSEPYDYIHKGLNSSEFLIHFKDDLKQSLTQTHNNALKVVVEELEALRYAMEEADGNIALVDVTIKNIKEEKMISPRNPQQ